VYNDLEGPSKSTKPVWTLYPGCVLNLTPPKEKYLVTTLKIPYFKYILQY